MLQGRTDRQRARRTHADARSVSGEQRATRRGVGAHARVPAAGRLGCGAAPRVPPLPRVRVRRVRRTRGRRARARGPGLTRATGEDAREGSHDGGARGRVRAGGRVWRRRLDVRDVRVDPRDGHGVAARAVVLLAQHPARGASVLQGGRPGPPVGRGGSDQSVRDGRLGRDDLRGDAPAAGDGEGVGALVRAGRFGGWREEEGRRQVRRGGCARGVAPRLANRRPRAGHSSRYDWRDHLADVRAGRAMPRGLGRANGRVRRGRRGGRRGRRGGRRHGPRWGHRRAPRTRRRTLCVPRARRRRRGAGSRRPRRRPRSRRTARAARAGRPHRVPRRARIGRRGVRGGAAGLARVLDRRGGVGERRALDVGRPGSRREGGVRGGICRVGSPRATPRDGARVHRQAPARAARRAADGGARAHQAPHIAPGAVLAEPRRRFEVTRGRFRQFALPAGHDVERRSVVRFADTGAPGGGLANQTRRGQRARASSARFAAQDRAARI